MTLMSLAANTASGRGVYGPLADVIVVDLSTGVAGAYGSKLLADYGAYVLKVEQPGTGDELRREPPFSDPYNASETSVLHLYLNSSKQSLTLDVSQATGRSILHKLLGDASVLLVDGRPGQLDALGLSTEIRAREFPALVTTAISAYGSTGPYADWPATNLTSFAMGGQMALTGEPDQEPLKNAGYQGEYQAGLNAFTATLCGLWAAGEDDTGDEIDISAMECMASTLELMLNSYCYLQQDNWSGRRGNVMSAAIGLYPAADGYLGVHAMPRNWPALARLMDAEWAVTDDRFSDAAARLAHDDELRALTYAWSSQQNASETYLRAGELRAPVAFVHDMPALLASEHLKSRDYFVELEHPVAATMKYPGLPFSMSETPGELRRAPLLGEHTNDVLNAFGYDAKEIELLRANGTV